MTAPDPCMEEIEGRLSKSVTDAQFGDVLRIIWATYYFGADLQWHNARTGDVEQAETLAEEIEASEGDWGWPIPAADVAYLLAELRKAQDKLARVEGLAANWEARGEHDMEFSKTIPDEDIAMVLLTEGASMVENARHIRNAVRAAVADATGGGDS